MINTNSCNLLSEEASAPTTPGAATGDGGSTAPPNWLLDEVRDLSFELTWPLVKSMDYFLINLTPQSSPAPSRWQICATTSKLCNSCGESISRLCTGRRICPVDRHAKFVILATLLDFNRYPDCKSQLVIGDCVSSEHDLMLFFPLLMFQKSRPMQ